MGKYEGSLRTSENDAALPASLELEDGRVKIAIGDTPIGDWPLKEVQFEKIPSGFKVAAEGEHVLMDLDPNEALALGVQLNNISKKKRRRRKSPAEGEPKQETKRPRNEAKASTKADEEAKPNRRQLKKQQAAEETASPQPIILEPQSYASTPEPELVAEAPSAPPVEKNQPKETRKARKAREKAERAASIEAAKVEKAAKIDAAKAAKVEEAAAAKAEKASKERLSVFQWLKTKIPYYIDYILDAVEPRLEPYLPKWVFNRATVIVVFTAVLAIPFFPGIMSLMFLILGGLIVALGAVVYADSVMASRLLYGRTTPNQVLVVGVLTFFFGLAIAIVAN